MRRRIPPQFKRKDVPIDREQAVFWPFVSVVIVEIGSQDRHKTCGRRIRVDRQAGRRTEGRPSDRGKIPGVDIGSDDVVG